MHSVSCLNEPTQLLICLIVVGGSALISGETVCAVGDQPSALFLHPNSVVVCGTIIDFDGLNVHPQNLALDKTSIKLSSNDSSVLPKIYKPSAILVILSSAHISPYTNANLS